MRALVELGEALARRVQRRRVEEIAQQWREALPGVSVRAERETITIEARGLGRRWLTEPMLRFAGRLWR